MRINIFRSYFCPWGFTWGGAGGGGRAKQHSHRRGGRATNPKNRHSTPTQPPPRAGERGAGGLNGHILALLQNPRRLFTSLYCPTRHPLSLRGLLIPHEGKGLLFMYLGISALHRGGFAGLRRF